MVVIAQFIKGWKCGEQSVLPNLPNIQLLYAKPVGNKFIKDMNKEEKNQTLISQNKCLIKALELVDKGQCDLLILDEIIDTRQLDMIDDKLFNKAIYEKPESLELVITGHNPDEQLLKRADYVTEMIKHNTLMMKAYVQEKVLSFRRKIR